MLTLTQARQAVIRRPRGRYRTVRVRSHRTRLTYWRAVLFAGNRPFRCADCGGRAMCKPGCPTGTCPDCGAPESCLTGCPRLAALSL